MRKLQVLKPGDRVGLVAPGAIFNRDTFQKSLRRLKEMQLVPVLGKNLFKKDFIFAGTVEERVQSLQDIFSRPDIKAIWCVRGGCGTSPVAEELSRRFHPRTSKIVIGMSDITALHLLMLQKWKWPVFHGPLFDRLGVAPKTSFEQRVLRRALFENEFRLELKSGLKLMGRKKTARGILVGGNLAILANSLGSSFEVDTRGKILFLEDIGERAYRIDRMLSQLEIAGKFKNIKGLILGSFTQCVEPDGRELWKTVFKRHFEKAPFPCLSGVPSGHGDVRLTLPMGVKVEIGQKSTPFFRVLETPFL